MSLLRQTVRLALPAITENLFNSGVFLVDALMVASLGPTPLAATGLASVVFWRLRMTAGVLQIGAGATVARRWGEGNYSAAGTVFSHGVVLSFLAGMLCIPLFFLARPFFHFLNAEGDVLEQIVPYFQITILCWPMRMASVNMASSLRAAGDTRTPMLTTLLMNLINILGNWVFIFGNLGAPRLELFGAGLATSLSVIVEFLLLLSVGYRGISPRRLQFGMGEAAPAGAAGAVFRFAADGWRLRIPGVTRTILRVSHPSFWEEIAVSIGFLGFFAMIADLGRDALAAQTAAVRIESFSFNIGFGISLAAATLVGQAMGARSVVMARRVFSLCVTLGFSTMGIMGILFALYPDWFLQWFVAESGKSFLPLARLVFIISALEQPFVGASQVLSGGMRGAGYTRAPFLSQLMGTILIRIGVGYYLCFTLDMGLEGLVWATVIDWLGRTLLLGGIFLSGKWEKVQI
jgi:putative MATE family efflux protein